MTFRKREPEVFVSGAGPVGMFAALCLAETGLDFRIVDKDVRRASHSYALALHPDSIEMLCSLGLADEDVAGGERVDTIALYDEQRRHAAIRLSELPAAYPYLLVLRQSRVEQLLEKLLKDAHRKVEWTHRVSAVDMDEHGVNVTVDRMDRVPSGYAVAIPEWQVVQRKVAHPAFLIGADGASSLVRRWCGVDWSDTSPPAQFAVFEFDSDYPLDHEVRVVLGDRSTSVVWPLPDGKVRWSFELVDSSQDWQVPREKSRYPMQTHAEFDARLNEELLARMLSQRAPWFDARPGEITWTTVVTFANRLASPFAGSRFALCGDASHSTGPVGVQSMNLGFAEARDLVGRLTQVMRDQAHPRVIEEWGERWRSEWQFLLGLEGELSAGPTTDEWIARNRHRIRNCLPGRGKGYGILAQQLGLDVRHTTMADSA